MLAIDFFSKYSSHTTNLKYFYRKPSILEETLIYFLLFVYRIFKNGLRLNQIKREKFKVMLEAANMQLDKTKAFSLLEWWDDKAIDQKDILFFTFGGNETGRKKELK